MVSFMPQEYYDNLPQCKRCECNKPSLLILANKKDNEIIDLIYDHASLIPCCFTHW